MKAPKTFYINFKEAALTHHALKKPIVPSQAWSMCTRYCQEQNDQ